MIVLKFFPCVITDSTKETRERLIFLIH
uniref:Uncharacterized protein n=1 Tax=Anguilla anguilla TaxID=7936 RepID=A0A0E9PN51_ANGAN